GARRELLREVQSPALAARKIADLLLLIGALEVEAAQIGARGHLEFPDLEHVGAAGYELEHRLAAFQRLAGLVDHGHPDRRPDGELALVRLLLARDHPEQGRLARPVGPDDADDRARRHRDREAVDEQGVAVALAHALELDHGIAEAVGDRDEDLLRLVALLVFVRVQLLEAREPRLGLGLPPLRVLPHPLELLLDRLLARGLRGFLLLQARFLLLQPRAVVALPRYAVPALELAYPLPRLLA